MPDILIRGMEMPCKGTHLLEVWNDGEKVIVYGHHKEYKGEPFNLIELPEHGDLIDRSEIKTNMVDEMLGKKVSYVNREQIINAPVIVPSNKEGSE